MISIHNEWWKWNIPACAVMYSIHDTHSFSIIIYKEMLLNFNKILLLIIRLLRI